MSYSKKESDMKNKQAMYELGIVNNPPKYTRISYLVSNLAIFSIEWL